MGKYDAGDDFTGNAGTIETNAAGGVIFNKNLAVVKINNGTVYNVRETAKVLQNNGTQYFLVKVSNAHSSSQSKDLISAYGHDWIKQTGTAVSTAAITVTPDSGYRITDITGSGDNVSAVRNPDGRTWTVTVTSGAYTTINVSTSPLDKEEIPSAVFSAAGTDSGILSNVSYGMKYSIDGGSNWTSIAETSVTISSGVTTTNGIKVYKSGNETTTADSDIQTINITRAQMPTGLAGTDCTENGGGTITGVTAEMEYKKSDAAGWTKCTGSVIDNLEAGSYDVRIAAAGTVLASDIQSLAIAAYEDNPAAKYTLTVEQGTASGSYAAGEVVTIKADSPETGKQFKGWTSEDAITFADANATETTFTMPARDVTVTATYEDIPDPALKMITAEATGFAGAYDGQPHGITVKVTEPADGAAIRYGTKAGTYDLTASPEITNVADSPLTVYYQITAEGYNPLTGSVKVTINKTALVITAPKPVESLVYTGSALVLVTPGNVENDAGTMYYAVRNDENTPKAEEYTTSIPAKTDAGTYYVWYKVAGDANHTDSEPACIEVSIAAAEEAQPGPEPQPAPGPEPQPAPEPEPQPAPEPEPQPQPEPKPEPQPEPQPAPAPQPDPNPQPAPGSSTPSAWTGTTGRTGLFYFPAEKHWYYLINEVIQWDYSGFLPYDNHWFMITEGIMDEKANGLYDYDGGTFMFAAGQLRTDYSGLWQNPRDNRWSYLANGQVQKQYTGLVQYDGAWFYVVKGVMDTDFTGVVFYDGAAFYVMSGQLDTGFNGTITYDGVEFSVIGGQLVT